jgi:hypothetical protein
MGIFGATSCRKRKNCSLRTTVKSDKKTLARPALEKIVEEEISMTVTDEEFALIQKIVRVSRRGHPCTRELIADAAPLIEAGLVELHSNGDMSVPARVQIYLAANGRLLTK